MQFQKALDIFLNKFHLLIACGTQGAIFAYHFKTGHDLGPGVVNTVYAFYALLVGHAFTYQKYPDGMSQTSTSQTSSSQTSISHPPQEEAPPGMGQS
jgi:hypothetical protein